MRNPKWHRDEIILALDLYFSEDRGSIDSKNKNIISISQVLNDLPLFPNRPDKERFRNANGVTLKLSNFLAFDPNYKGIGMKSGSKLDKVVFEEFYWKRKELRILASKIKRIAEDPILRSKLSTIEEDDQTETDSVKEGQVLYKLHKYRERVPAIVIRKKNQAIGRFGKLNCEACTFEFEPFYGEIGNGYIECHHRTPLYRFKIDTTTTLDDLALVCSNCHRMLHRRIDTISVEDLSTMIRYNRA
jgi:5-methylcytosine-specific restriction protein A